MKLTLFLLGLALAFAAGCGGGGGGALSKEQYGKELTAICRDYSAQARKLGGFNSVGDLAARGQQLIDAFQRVIDRAEELKPPDALKGPAGRFLALGRQLHDKLVELVAAARKGDGTALADVQRSIEPLGAEWNDIARKRLDAPACVQGG